MASLLDWNKTFQDLIDGLTDDYVLEQETEFRELADLARDFVQTATTLGKIIIQERHLKSELKTIRPQKIGGSAGGEKYKAHNIVWKFVAQDPDTIRNYYNNSLENAAKTANHELLGLSAIHQFGSDLGLHVPLCCSVDYLGCRLVALSFLPIDAKTLVYGSRDQGAAVLNSDKKLDQNMKKLAKRLNLKTHTIRLKDGTLSKEIYTCFDLEGHRGVDNRYYVIDASRLFPSEWRPGEKSGLYHMLRPELVRTNSVPLSSDWYLKVAQHDQKARIEAKAVRKRLHDKVIPGFARWLDDQAAASDDVKDGVRVLRPQRCRNGDLSRTSSRSSFCSEVSTPGGNSVGTGGWMSPSSPGDAKGTPATTPSKHDRKWAAGAAGAAPHTPVISPTSPATPESTGPGSTTTTPARGDGEAEPKYTWQTQYNTYWTDVDSKAQNMLENKYLRRHSNFMYTYRGRSYLVDLNAMIFRAEDERYNMPVRRKSTIPTPQEQEEYDKIREDCRLPLSLSEDEMVPVELIRENLSAYLHRKGINVRHLGYVRCHVSSPYWYGAILVEAVARTLKQILRKKFREVTETWTKTNAVSGILLEPFRFATAQFLNVWFGNSTRSAKLWKLLSKDVEKRFPGIFKHSKYFWPKNLNKGMFYASDYSIQAYTGEGDGSPGVVRSTSDPVAARLSTVPEKGGTLPRRSSSADATAASGWDAKGFSLKDVFLRFVNMSRIELEPSVLESLNPVKDENGRMFSIFDFEKPFDISQIIDIGAKVKEMNIASYAQGTTLLIRAVRKNREAKDAGGHPMLQENAKRIARLAMKKFDQALKFNLSDHVVLCNYGMLTSMLFRAEDLARKMYNAALQIEDTHVRSIYYLAIGLKRKKKFVEADKMYRTAVKVSKHRHINVLRDFAMFLSNICRNGGDWLAAKKKLEANDKSRNLLKECEKYFELAVEVSPHNHPRAKIERCEHFLRYYRQKLDPKLATMCYDAVKSTADSDIWRQKLVKNDLPESVIKTMYKCVNALRLYAEYLDFQGKTEFALKWFKDTLDVVDMLPAHHQSPDLLISYARFLLRHSILPVSVTKACKYLQTCAQGQDREDDFQSNAPSAAATPVRAAASRRPPPKVVSAGGPGVAPASTKAPYTGMDSGAFDFKATTPTAAVPSGSNPPRITRKSSYNGMDSGAFDSKATTPMSRTVKSPGAVASGSNPPRITRKSSYNGMDSGAFDFKATTPTSGPNVLQEGEVFIQSDSDSTDDEDSDFQETTFQGPINVSRSIDMGVVIDVSSEGEEDDLLDESEEEVLDDDIGEDSPKSPNKAAIAGRPNPSIPSPRLGRNTSSLELQRLFGAAPESKLQPALLLRQWSGLYKTVSKFEVELIDKLKTGMAVEAQYEADEADERWYPAQVISLHNDQKKMVTIKYNLYEDYVRIDRKLIRVPSVERPRTPPGAPDSKRRSRSPKRRRRGSKVGNSGRVSGSPARANLPVCSACGATGEYLVTIEHDGKVICCHCESDRVRASRQGRYRGESDRVRASRQGRDRGELCPRCGKTSHAIASRKSSGRIKPKWCVVCWSQLLPPVRAGCFLSISWKKVHALMHRCVASRGLRRRKAAPRYVCDPLITRAYAEFLVIHLRRPNIAQGYWKKAKQRDPYNLRLYLEWGVFWKSVGDLAWATAAFREGVNMANQCEGMWTSSDRAGAIQPRLLRAMARLYQSRFGVRQSIPQSRKTLPTAFNAHKRELQRLLLSCLEEEEKLAQGARSFKEEVEQLKKTLEIDANEKKRKNRSRSRSKGRKKIEETIVECGWATGPQVVVQAGDSNLSSMDSLLSRTLSPSLKNRRPRSSGQSRRPRSSNSKREGGARQARQNDRPRSAGRKKRDRGKR